MTSIEWTDESWNPVHGCTRVSEGCRNCWAERFTARMSNPGMWGHGFAERTPAGPRWTGKVELIPSALDAPLHWRKPKKVFLSSFDLFHEALPDEDIARVFAVMALAERHTFQVLTKRPERMRALLSQRGDHPPASFLSRVGAMCEGYAERVERLSVGAMMGFYAWWQGVEERGLLSNVWLGVSVEDQATADERIPLLLQTPAAVRFVSYEPALAPVDLRRWMFAEHGRRHIGAQPGLSWVIVGGESGPGARPFSLAWARTIVAQCKAAGVPCFVKQLGRHPIDWREDTPEAPPYEYRLESAKGGDWSEWPEDLRVREFPKAAA